MGPDPYGPGPIRAGARALRYGGNFLCVKSMSLKSNMSYIIIFTVFFDFMRPIKMTAPETMKFGGSSESRPLMAIQLVTKTSIHIEGMGV